MKRARRHRDECVEGSYKAGWWDGHMRCLQLMLEMEDE